MGTLGQKLDYLTDTKSILKQKINNLGGSLTDQSTFRSYGDYLDELYNEMPKVTGEGTEITLTPTRKGRMQLDLKGNTSQATRILPEGYTQLDYIESTGTQYIDTGRFSTPNTKFEMDYISTKQLGDTFQCLFGSQNGNYTRRFYILLGSAKNNVQLQFPHDNDHPLFMQNDGTFTSIQKNTDVIVNAGEKNKIIFDNINRSVTIGQYTSVSTSTYEILPSNHNILILAKNDNTTPTSNFATGKLYRFKWYENNVSTMDFVPCKNASNVVGLYDLVSQTFFGNAGTGDFVAGNEVSIPNPDYPQPIHVVTGNNSVGVQGKNLFDKDNYNIKSLNAGGGGTFASASNQKHIYIQCKPNTDYVVVKNVSNIPVLGIYETENEPAVGVAYTSLYFSSNSDGKRHVTTSATAQYLDVRINTDAITQAKIDAIVETLIIAEGTDTNISYVPYYHADYPINLGSIELCKIGDYQDYLYKENGNWYKYNAISKTTLNGSETYTSANTSVNINTTRYYARTSINRVASVGLFNKFVNRDASMSHGDYEYNWFNGTDFYINILKSRLSEVSTDGIKQYVTSNNLTGYGALNTPTTTQITDETLIAQLNAIENAMSTTDTTTITQTNSDLPFIITASALKPFTTETSLTSLTDGE